MQVAAQRGPDRAGQVGRRAGLGGGLALDPGEVLGGLAAEGLLDHRRGAGTDAGQVGEAAPGGERGQLVVAQGPDRVRGPAERRDLRAGVADPLEGVRDALEGVSGLHLADGSVPPWPPCRPPCLPSGSSGRPRSGSSRCSPTPPSTRRSTGPGRCGPRGRGHRPASRWARRSRWTCASASRTGSRTRSCSSRKGGGSPGSTGPTTCGATSSSRSTAARGVRELFDWSNGRGQWFLRLTKTPQKNRRSMEQTLERLAGVVEDGPEQGPA